MKKKDFNEGKVYYGKTRFIDRDSKPRRRFVVTKDTGVNVEVAKLTSIKELDVNNENSRKNVAEIKSTYKGLTRRTGVFERVYNRNRVTKEKLRLDKGNGVFDDKFEFELDDEDFDKVLKHVKKAKRHKKKKGKH
ncbi:MAG: hypothetical protein LBP79_04745 [Clostridiales bacterium]|jgi:hypothetical protein|nr:hypothetical protein [Clostridiales bacterium]